MPGQRSVVVVSPGFLTPETDMLQDYMDVVERALHSDVMISTLDARGLYVVLPGGDISRESHPLSPFAAAMELQYETESAVAEDDILSDLANATGGAFFHNNNDLDAGFKQVSATPEYFYILGFSPQNLKAGRQLSQIESLAEKSGEADAASPPRILCSKTCRRPRGRSEAGDPGRHLLPGRNARPAGGTAYPVF